MESLDPQVVLPTHMPVTIYIQNILFLVHMIICPFLKLPLNGQKTKRISFFFCFYRLAPLIIIYCHDSLLCKYMYKHFSFPWFNSCVNTPVFTPDSHTLTYSYTSHHACLPLGMTQLCGNVTERCSKTGAVTGQDFHIGIGKVRYCRIFTLVNLH